MKITKLLPIKRRRLFKMVIVGSQEEVWKFVERLSLPVMTSVYYRISNEKESRISFKCSSEESYKELYQKIDDIILEYI